LSDDGNACGSSRENRGQEVSMDVQQELLERFTKSIDLPAFAWQQGFRLSADQQPGSLRMEHPRTGEAMLVEHDLDRGWRYRMVDDPQQRGSVVDFLARREGVTRTECLGRLAGCADTISGRSSQEADRYRAVLRERPEALEHARRVHEAEKLQERAAGRMLERLGVPRGALDELRFGAVRREADALALTTEPECLWASRYRKSDRAIVLVERPIDAVAYERAIGKQGVCYVATGGRLNDEKQTRLRHLLADVPAGVTVVLAFGRDQAGRALADEVQRLAPKVTMERQTPQLGARWADQMQLEQRHSLSLRRAEMGRTL
jgi:hypothetical protein